VLVAPARSEAAFEILIQEVDSGGNVVALPGGGFASGLFTSNVQSGFATPSFNNILVSVNSNSGPTQAINSITAQPSARISANFDPTHSLRITVTDLGFNNSNPNGIAVATSSLGASTGIQNGVTTVTNQTFVMEDPYTPASGLNPTTGTVLAQTGTVIDVRPSNQISNPSDSPQFILPGSFAIQHVITLSVTAGSGDPTNQTFGGTASSVVQAPTAPVPAPAGVLLGLIALPALALRRAFRRTPAAAV